MRTRRAPHRARAESDAPHATPHNAHPRAARLRLGARPRGLQTVPIKKTRPARPKAAPPHHATPRRAAGGRMPLARPVTRCRRKGPSRSRGRGRAARNPLTFLGCENRGKTSQSAEENAMGSSKFPSAKCPPTELTGPDFLRRPFPSLSRLFFPPILSIRMCVWFPSLRFKVRT